MNFSESDRRARQRQRAHGLTAALSAAVVTLAAPQALAEPEVVARVIVASGTVTAEGDGNARSLERRSEVYEGDAVVTEPDSQAQLRFKDGAVLSLDPETELIIRAYQHTPGEEDESEALLEMVEGGLRNLTGAMADEFPDGYEVETPVAGIGIRGTDFQAVMDEDGLAVGVWDETAHVTNAAGSVDLGPDLPHQFAEVADAQTPPQPTLQRPGRLSASGDLDEDLEEAEEETDTDTERPQRSARSTNTTQTTGSASADDALQDDTATRLERDPLAQAAELYRDEDDRPLFGSVALMPLESDSEDPQAGFTAPASATSPEDDDALVLGLPSFQTEVENPEVVDFGWLIPTESLGETNQVDDLPVVWGEWADSEEVFFFTRDDEDELTVGPAEDLFDLDQGGWLVATEEIISLEQLNARDEGQTTATFDAGASFASGEVASVLTSSFSQGELVEEDSSFSMTIDLDAEMISGMNMLFVVDVGDGFETWDGGGEGIPISDDDGQLGIQLTEDNSFITVEQPDNEFSASGDLHGVIVDAEPDDLETAFAGGINLQALSPDSGEVATDGNVLFILPEGGE